MSFVFIIIGVGAFVVLVGWGFFSRMGMSGRTYGVLELLVLCCTSRRSIEKTAGGFPRNIFVFFAQPFLLAVILYIQMLRVFCFM